MAGRRARRKAAQDRAAAAAPMKLGRETVRERGKCGVQHLSGAKRLEWARIQHLEKVAAWASSAVPPLGALLGARLAASCEKAGLPPSPATQRSSCLRCESLLHPGVNCSVRQAKKERNTSPPTRKGSPHGKHVIYKCHYCEHSSRKPAPRPVRDSKLKAEEALVTPPPLEQQQEQGKSLGLAEDADHSHVTATEPRVAPTPSTPASLGSSRKRKRKGWTSLKDIASQNVEQARTTKKLTPTVAFMGPKAPTLSNQMLRQLYSSG